MDKYSSFNNLPSDTRIVDPDYAYQVQLLILYNWAPSYGQTVVPSSNGIDVGELKNNVIDFYKQRWNTDNPPFESISINEENIYDYPNTDDFLTINGSFQNYPIRLKVNDSHYRSIKKIIELLDEIIDTKKSGFVPSGESGVVHFGVIEAHAVEKGSESGNDVNIEEENEILTQFRAELIEYRDRIIIQKRKLAYEAWLGIVYLNHLREDLPYYPFTYGLSVCHGSSNVMTEQFRDSLEDYVEKKKLLMFDVESDSSTQKLIDNIETYKKLIKLYRLRDIAKKYNSYEQISKKLAGKDYSKVLDELRNQQKSYFEKMQRIWANALESQDIPNIVNMPSLVGEALTKKLHYRTEVQDYTKLLKNSASQLEIFEEIFNILGKQEVRWCQADQENDLYLITDNYQARLTSPEYGLQNQLSQSPHYIDYISLLLQVFSAMSYINMDDTILVHQDLKVKNITIEKLDSKDYLLPIFLKSYQNEKGVKIQQYAILKSNSLFKIINFGNSKYQYSLNNNTWVVSAVDNQDTIMVETKDIADFYVSCIEDCFARLIGDKDRGVIKHVYDKLPKRNKDQFLQEVKQSESIGSYQGKITDDAIAQIFHLGNLFYLTFDIPPGTYFASSENITNITRVQKKYSDAVGIILDYLKRMKLDRQMLVDKETFDQLKENSNYIWQRGGILNYPDIEIVK